MKSSNLNNKMLKTDLQQKKYEKAGLSSLDSTKFGVRAVVISNKSGLPFITLKLDESVNENIMVPFLSAIHTFCENLVSVSQELTFHTADFDIYVFVKSYSNMELMIFALMDQEMKKINLRDEAESALDVFVRNYPVDMLQDWDGNLEYFKAFEEKLQTQVTEYLQRTQFGKLTGMRDRLKLLWSRLFQ
ncbi:MAG: hypothetical protein K9W44_00680 [Candidatus Lokiarchaeota archaeon]|nr:hypothetical protein [Candidatus Harpocratesius repetitus]